MPPSFRLAGGSGASASREPGGEFGQRAAACVRARGRGFSRRPTPERCRSASVPGRPPATLPAPAGRARCRGLAEAADGAFQVAHLAQGFARLSQTVRRGEQVGDESLPGLQRGHVAQRVKQPLAQLPRAQRRHRAVKRGEQARAPFRARLDDFQVRLRNRVQHQEGIGPVAAQREHVLQRPAHLVLQIVKNRALPR